MKKQNKRLSISVIGSVGHVGLPLTFSLAKKKFQVIGIDIDQKKINLIKNKKIPFLEKGLSSLVKNQKNLKLLFTNNLEEIKKTKVIIVTLGTPIDEFLNPSYTYFFKIIDKIIKLLTNNHILILRSTLAPGTTRKIINRIRKKKLKTGVAFCPERISQGNALKEIAKLPQIISFTDNKTKTICKKIFQKFNKKIIECSFEEAEVAKLYCNSWRYIKFAVANEFYKICKLNDLNFEKIRDAMMIGYPRAFDFPTSGFAAGPCLLKDTMQLASFSREHFTFGNSAMLANESLPDFLVEQTKKKISLKGKKVLILGMSFKPNSDDHRDSLAFRLKKKLEGENAQTYCHDPFIKEYNNNKVSTLVKKCSLIFVGCPHDKYKYIRIPNNKKIIDCWGFFKDR